MEKAGATSEELDSLGKGSMYAGVIEGDLENGSLMAGQIVGLIRDIKPVKDIIEEIMQDAEKQLTRLTHHMEHAE